MLAVLLAFIVDAAMAQSAAGQTQTSINLQGTGWQLVRFQGSDGTTLTPDDKAK